MSVTFFSWQNLNLMIHRKMCKGWCYASVPCIEACWRGSAISSMILFDCFIEALALSRRAYSEGVDAGEAR